jgi:hypothetical protein
VAYFAVVSVLRMHCVTQEALLDFPLSSTHRLADVVRSLPELPGVVSCACTVCVFYLFTVVL